MRINLKLAGLSGIVLAALTLAACSADPVPNVTKTATPAPSASRAAVPSPPPEPEPAIVWPLTGLDATEASADDLARPALSIKIENSAAARPQENLDAADVVFEEYVESGISRLVAVYHSDVPESVGPIRSMRPMDKNIMGSFKGPLIYSGAQVRFTEATVASGQKVITSDLGASGFYRTSDKASPHNLHGYTADFYEQAGDMPAPPQQWDYAKEDEEPTAATGTAASAIKIHMSQYSNPSWNWDDSKNLWMRSEDGNPHVTTAGTQIGADNVVVLDVTVKYTSGSSKSSVPETIVAGQNGTGIIASGNAQLPIKWSKAGQYDPWVFTTEDGDPVELLQGKTWVELIPNKGVSNDTSVAVS
ncbi:DUF3048 domain-containing protein [Demequina aurantiaca]|uniref:DUF3048 domain-containing protein n=1 Tax=Demequina aurantiaca TaxID=676200 RepID=UPI000A02FDA6|nr:DUF3048 domain-containing protein [Demequina aurantiaca]